LGNDTLDAVDSLETYENEIKNNTAGIKTKTETIANQSKNFATTSSVAPNNLFKDPVTTKIKNLGELASIVGGEDKTDNVSKKEHNAIQAGISAVLGTDSGGIGRAKQGKNAAFNDAYDSYKAETGKSKDDFIKEISAAMANKQDADEEAYNVSGTYSTNNKGEITSGSFPDTKVSGWGWGWGDNDTVTVELPNGHTQYDVPVSNKKNTVNDGTKTKLNKLSGGTPAKGWVAMLDGMPYIYNDQWRKVDHSGLKKDMKNYLNGTYKEGGLADFTGPAWLDGTKSKPEIVLNQTDSANFMQLRDILADILNGTSSVGSKKEQKSGDNYYDVEITVESISDDYDVEQMAEKIKSMIYEDSIYRNVNSINNIR
jgi:hypothetical protein